MLLEDWFHAQQISIPIHLAAVFPRPQQQFENIRKDLTLLFPLEIPVFLRRLSSIHPSIEVPKLTDIANRISDAHREYDPFPLTVTHGIHPSELLTGVRCNRCGRFGMQSIYNGWGCPQCGNVDAHAHVQALLDYFMLIDYRISNKDCRCFLHIDNVQKVKRILGQYGIPFEGERRGRFYVADLKVIRELHTFVGSKVPK